MTDIAGFKPASEKKDCVMTIVLYQVKPTITDRRVENSTKGTEDIKIGAKMTREKGVL